jgi:hypothetical protein
MTFLKSVKRFIMNIVEVWQETREMQAKEYTKWHS